MLRQRLGLIVFLSQILLSMTACSEPPKQSNEAIVIMSPAEEKRQDFNNPRDLELLALQVLYEIVLEGRTDREVADRLMTASRAKQYAECMIENRRDKVLQNSWIWKISIEIAKGIKAHNTQDKWWPRPARERELPAKQYIVRVSEGGNVNAFDYRNPFYVMLRNNISPAWQALSITYAGLPNGDFCLNDEETKRR